MRPIKMFGLAAITAVAAMAFVGATSASALPTQLCKVHTGLLCGAGNAATDVHATLPAGQVGRLLSSLATILCLTVLIQATSLELANPQIFHGLDLKFENCGTNANHTNCEVEVEELPLSHLLKTGLDTGSLTALNGQSRVICENIFGFIDIDCKYNTTGILFAAGGGHLTANETSVTEVGDKSLCPNTSKLDGLVKGLLDEGNVRLDYILG